MIDDPYKNLANAIIVQAAKDYQKALRQLRRNPKYEPAQYTKNAVLYLACGNGRRRIQACH